MSEPLYSRRVRVNVLTDGGPWAMLNNGLPGSGLRIDVCDGAIRIHDPWLPTRLGRYFRTDITVEPIGLSMYRDRVGWDGIWPERHESIVLGGFDPGIRTLWNPIRETAYAVRPTDGDLDALEAALAAVGVTAAA